MSAYKSTKILKDTQESIKQIQTYLMQRDGLYYPQSTLISIAIQGLRQRIQLQKNNSKKDGTE